MKSVYESVSYRWIKRFFFMENGKPTFNKIPENDSDVHFETLNCKCNPEIVEVDNCFVIIHNSFDGREAVKEANDLLGIYPDRISGNIEDYYHPTIDEFHVGFEYVSGHYEDNDPIDGKVTLEDMYLDTFTANDFEFCFDYDDSSGWKEYSVPRILMVKRLDSDDIISLGFKQISNDETEHLFNNIELGIYLSVSLNKDNLIQIYKFDKKTKDVLFKGHLMNKSELKRLINLLAI